MLHNFKIGDKTITIDACCGHPEMKDNSTASIGCSGNCQSCKYCNIEIKAPDFWELYDVAIAATQN